jgi:hypothetical protein
MKKFQIETLLITLGVLLVLCIAGKQCWEQVVYATDSCTQSCASENHACAGTNITLSCSGCSYNTSGQTWYDPIVRGSTSGTSAIAFTSVNCNRIIPCHTTATYTGHRCTGTGACLSAIYTPYWNECATYATGAEHVNTVMTCYTASCEE